MKRSRVSIVASNLILFAAAALVLAPLVWMALAALRDPAKALAPLSEWEFSWANIQNVIATVPLGRYYLNSIMTSVAILLGQFLLCLPAGYALARLRFRGQTLSFWLVIVGLILPTQAMAIPAYILLGRLGWLDTPVALIIPFVGSPFAIFIFRQYILSIPQSVFDAARIDGVGPLMIVVRIVTPLAIPALVAQGVFSFVHHWNDLFWPTLVLTSDTWATIPYAVARYASTGQEGLQYGAQMATGLLAMLPLLIGFAFAQRLFVQGVADGAAR
jgi:multiple sugar transport system permease protein